jgi:hypothetical protein
MAQVPNDYSKELEVMEEAYKILQNKLLEM